MRHGSRPRRAARAAKNHASLESGRCRSWCARTIAKSMGMRIRRIAPENGTQSVEPEPKPACRLCAALARNPKAGKGRSFRCHCCVATRGSSSSSSARGKIHASLLSRDFGRCFPPPGPGHPGRPPHARSHVLSVARLQHEQLLQRPCRAAAWAHRCWHAWQAGWRGSFRHPRSRWPLWQAPVALSTLAQSFPEAPRALPGCFLPLCSDAPLFVPLMMHPFLPLCSESGLMMMMDWENNGTVTIGWAVKLVQLYADIEISRNKLCPVTDCCKRP